MDQRNWEREVQYSREGGLIFLLLFAEKSEICGLELERI